MHCNSTVRDEKSSNLGSIHEPFTRLAKVLMSTFTSLIETFSGDAGPFFKCSVNTTLIYPKTELEVNSIFIKVPDHKSAKLAKNVLPIMRKLPIKS